MTLIARVLFVIAVIAVHGTSVTRQLADVFKRLVTQTAVQILVSLLWEILMTENNFVGWVESESYVFTVARLPWFINLL